MNIVCFERKSITKDLVMNSIKFLIKELKLTNSHYNLYVIFNRGMAKTEDTRGYVSQIGPKDLSMVLDTSLDLERLIITISHEMVHVKQYARGHVKHTGRGKTRAWMGKKIRREYYDQPWELEAFGKERILANKIFKIMNK